MSSSLSLNTVSTPVSPPFSSALALTALRSGCFQAELSNAWSVNQHGKQHGGLMLALVGKAGLAGLAEHTGSDQLLDPLAVSASYLRAPDTGPVWIGTEVVKVGRTASVVAVTLRQHDKPVITATVTAGQLPDAPVEWSRLPEMAAVPPEDGISTSGVAGPLPPLATACDVVLDPRTAGYLRGEPADPVLCGWVRPIGEEPDPLFALLAGDILPPVLFNMGRPGWAPTVQLTALVRARPAPGWLRLRAVADTVAGGWLDEDMTVIDSAGRLVCQARQLALAPRHTR
jgi:acyl-coenzyme A thioesterase PaaI-like protein